MSRMRIISPMILAVAVAIGCGGSKPQDANATSTEDRPEAPLQLAEAPAGAQPTGTSGSASVTGSVTFQGTPPAAQKVKMDADLFCKQQHSEPVMTEDVVVNSNGTLKNVFVYVKEGVSGSYTAPTTPVTLNQAGCWYTPHVFGIQVNQPLDIVNSDKTLHNVNAKPTANQPFNLAQPTAGMKASKKFAKPEIGIKFKCNVHPWMSAWGHAVAHPYFDISIDDGSFAIKGLPAGTYTLEAWHEKYGIKTQTVTVADGQAATADFTFSAQ